MWGFMLEKVLLRELGGFLIFEEKLLPRYYGFKYKYLHLLGNLAFMEKWMDENRYYFGKQV